MIKIYTAQKCGICKVIKAKLDMKNIPYEECQDSEYIQKTFNTNVVPIIETEDGLILDSPTKMKKWIDNNC